MRVIPLLAGLLACLPAGAQQGLPAPTGEAIVAPDARFEVLYTRPETETDLGGLTEGPAVAPTDRSISRTFSAAKTADAFIGSTRPRAGSRRLPRTAGSPTG